MLRGAVGGGCERGGRWRRGLLGLAFGLALASPTCARPDGSARDPDDAVADAGEPLSAGPEGESGGAEAGAETGAWSEASESDGGEEPISPEPEPEPEPAPTTAPQVSSAGPAMSLGRILGATERRIAAGVGRPGEPGEGGWIHFGPELAVRFEGGRAVEAAMALPAGLTCDEAAAWAGFRRAMPPIRHPDRCAWPGLSERHRLARGVAGELSPATGVLHVWRIADR